MPNNIRKSSPYYYREQVTCDGCGKEFEKYPYLVRPTNYCSMSCYHNSTRVKSERKCKICHKLFTPTATQIRHGFGIYCSRKCQNKPNEEKRIVQSCKQCGKIIARSPAVSKHTKYCGKACHDLAMSDFVAKKCAECHIEFTIPRSVINTGRGKFCSRECFIKFNGESSLEEKVRHYLEDHKINFIQEKKFGRYRADFVIENVKLVIECDGEFWHLMRHSIDRDTRKTKYLESLGYHVARLTGRQINEHWPECIRAALVY